MRKVTTPTVRANGLWNPFTGRKKWEITCGVCDHSWKEKVPIRETCSAICPCCGAQNKWSAREFADYYNEQIRKGRETLNGEN